MDFNNHATKQFEVQLKSEYAVKEQKQQIVTSYR